MQPRALAPYRKGHSDCHCRPPFIIPQAPALLFARLNSLPWRRRVRVRQLDWQRDRLHERFDLILGADIVYEKPQWPLLEKFWRNHLHQSGMVLIGEPGRATGEEFAKWIIEQGWLIEIQEEPVETRQKPIRLFSLKMNENL